MAWMQRKLPDGEDMGMAAGPRLCNPGGKRRLRESLGPRKEGCAAWLVSPIAFLTTVVTWGRRWLREGGWEGGDFLLFIGLIVRAAKWPNKGKSVPLPESHPDHPGGCLGVCDQNAVPLSSVPSGYPHAPLSPTFPTKPLSLSSF